MKNHLLSLKCALLAIVLMSGIHVSAYDFYTGGIYYNKLSSNTVEVTYKDIMNNAYSGNVTIPSSITVNNVTYTVKGIGVYAFYLCTNLTGVSLPNTITIIDGCAFEKCSKLTGITIPNSVTTLGVDAFASCTSLQSIDIPYSVTKIDQLAFAGCSAMTTATIGSGVTSIAEKAFSGCSALTSITCLASTPPTMKNSNCFDASTYSSATLNVPGAALNAYKSADWWRMFNSIEALSFDFCVDGIYYKKTSSNTVEVTYKDIMNNAYSGNVTIPSSITVNNVTYTVKGIGVYAFYLCTNLTGVSLPNTITIIDGCAFEKCSKLTGITIPNSVTKIDQLAFAGCSAMTTATIGSGVTSIAEKAFSGCSALTSITCMAATPPTMKNSNCFDASTYSSATLNVPGGSLNAYKSADWWRMFNSINALPFDFYVNGIYYKKTSNNTVEVTYRDIMAEDYSGSVTIPSSIKVNNVTYSVTAIGVYAMYMCKNLTSIALPNTITKIDGCAFEKCSGLKMVAIPNSVTTLGIDAFASCPGLTMVVIPNSVTTVGDLAFYNCTALTSATIGSGVTSLGDKAFYGCTALNTIICSAKTPPTMKTNNCFSSSTYNSATLYVPRTSLTAYKTADWWRMFVSIFGTDSGYDPCDVNGDGEVNIADINALINAILTNNDDPVYDANDDDEVNIADINFVIKAILNS